MKLLAIVASVMQLLLIVLLSIVGCIFCLYVLVEWAEIPLSMLGVTRKREGIHAVENSASKVGANT